MEGRKILILAIALIKLCLGEIKKPNVVIIMADDLGWNDVGFHGSSEIPTPNIDSLAYNGVILNRFYTPPLCTPSRSAFMTGKYSTRLGMNHYVIPSDEPWGLGLDEKLISEYFKEAGYKTHLVGKWHLGFYQKAYTPTLRGFDSHFGYLGPYIGYYDYSLMMHNRNYSRGYDMRRNLSVNYDIADPKPYATDLFTNEAVKVIENHDEKEPLFLVLTHLAPHAGNEYPDEPLEAPEEEIRKFEYIKDINRRKLAAMISVMDTGIGKVVAAIKNKGIMENTIILFYADNGGPTKGTHATEASNYPLRGQKGGPFEGGCRVVACIYSPLLESKGKVSNELIFVTDLLPTLLRLNIPIDDDSLDGFNQWDTISLGTPSPRKEVLYNIDQITGYSGLMIDGWKLVNGSENINYSEWLGSSGRENINISIESYIKNVLESDVALSLPTLDTSLIFSLRDQATIICEKKSADLKCNPLETPCIFNVIEDPCEFNNLAGVQPKILANLLARLEFHYKNIIPTRRKFSDSNCDPKNFKVKVGNSTEVFTWNWWQDDELEFKETHNYILLYLVLAAALLFFVGAMCVYNRITMSKKNTYNLEIDENLEVPKPRF